MSNSAGLGTISYTATPLATSITVRVGVLKATRLVPVTPRNFHGGFPVNIADAAVVTATRIDAAGSATGEVVNDELGNVWAVFAAAIAAGHWELAV